MKDLSLTQANLSSYSSPSEANRPPYRRVYSISEAQQLCCLSRATIYKLIGTGRLKTIKILRRRLIPVEEIESLLKGAA